MNSFTKVLTLIILILMIAACGSSDGVPTSATPPDQALTVQGGGIKGPMVNADVNVYAYRSSSETRFDTSNSIASGETGSDARIRELYLDPAALENPPLLVEFSSKETTYDLTTGDFPLIPVLKTVILDQESFNDDATAFIYATPVTTLAVELAIQMAKKNASNQEFQILLLQAEAYVSSLLGLPAGTDIFTASPVLNEQTMSLGSQVEVAQYRTASEHLGAIILKLLQAARDKNPDNFWEVEDIFVALAKDMKDGKVDGNGGPVFQGLNVKDIVMSDPATLTIPGTSLPLSTIGSRLLSEELPATCQACANDVTYTDHLAEISYGITPPKPQLTLINIDADDLSGPRIIAATAPFSSQVRIAFNRDMDNSALNKLNYAIAQENRQGEAGLLQVLSATFEKDPDTGLDRSVVLLTTQPQSELLYRLKASGVRDANGQRIDTSPSNSDLGFISANETTFNGTENALLFYACNNDAYGDLEGSACTADWQCAGASAPLEYAAGQVVNLEVLPGDYTAENLSAQCAVASEEAQTLDSDGDGVPDVKEVRGYTVVLVRSNGLLEEVQVTSNPYAADTDGDGVNDYDELTYGGNPRDTDTDGDGLDDNLELNVLYSSPYAADTDGDGLEDGLEYSVLQTSPIHADTDGDQLNDAHELFTSFRDPRIADLPDLSINIGNIFIALNEVFTYTEANGEERSIDSTSTATLGNTDTAETIQYGSNTEEVLNQYGVNITGKGGYSEEGKGFGWARAILNFEFNRNFIYSRGSDSTTIQEAQQVLEDSYSKGTLLTSNEEVVRQVESAVLNAEVDLVNDSDLAFEITDIEVTLLRMRPGTRKSEPVAVMLPQSGAGQSYYLGPFKDSVGPLVFQAQDLPVGLAEELMQNAAGLSLVVSNYRIIDEFGREFTHVNQEIHDQSVGLLIDYGFEGVERQQIAASAMKDLDADSPSYLQTIGGFDHLGRPKGIPLLYLLENQLGLEKNPTEPDAIIAGDNGTAETAALGDDVQKIAVGTRGLGVGSVIIEAGPNGVIDSVPAQNSSNVTAVTKGFDVNRTCGSNSPLIFQGQKACSSAPDVVAQECLCTPENGCPNEFNVDGNGDPVDYSAAACDGPSVITRVGGYSNKPGLYRWVALTDTQLPASADVESIVMKPGESFELAFIQDLDEDGLFARTEFLLGSTDSALNQEDNTLFGDTYRADGPESACSGQTIPEFCGEEATQPVPFPLADSRDTDRDGMDDNVEYLEGWEVAPNGQNRRKVYPSPYLRDSDGDGLTDRQERDIRFSCTDSFVIAGENRTVDIATSPSGTVPKYTIFPYAQRSTVFSEETIVGYTELYKYEGFTQLFENLFSSISAPIVFGEDDRSTAMLPSFDEQSRNDPNYYTKIAPYCVPDESDPLDPTRYISRAASLDPMSADTDGDGISDGKEILNYYVGEAVVANTSYSEFSALDGANLLEAPDFNAYGDDILVRNFSATIQLGDVIVLPGNNGELDANYPELFTARFDSGVETEILEVRPGQWIRSNPLDSDTDGDLLSDGMELRLGTNPIDPTDADALQDSDGDGVLDIDESRGLSILVNGNSIVVRSNPTSPDSDGDGLPDFVEYQISSNPNESDTDNDGLSDYDELSEGLFGQYSSYAQRIENFSLDATNSAKYGTDLNKKDTDNDGLSDLEEINGFAIYEPVSAYVFTNPRLEDSDGDGYTDSQELNRKVSGESRPTNPVLADTDGDGRIDSREAALGTDPLQPDLIAIITMQHITSSGVAGDGANNAGEMTWWFTTQASYETAPTLLTSPSGYYLGDQNVPHEDKLIKLYYWGGNDQNVPACLWREMTTGWYFNIPLQNSYRQVILRPGDSFYLRGLFAEIDSVSQDCGSPPNFIPSWINDAQNKCEQSVSKLFTYEDMVISRGDTLSLGDADDGQCNFEMQYTIETR